MNRNSTMIGRLVLALVVISFAWASSARASISVIATDTFGHDAGAVVTGTTTETGGLTWQYTAAIANPPTIQANPDSFDAGSGSVSFGNPAGVDGDYVSFSAITTGIVTVQAQVKPLAGTDGSGDWIALGFNTSGTPIYSNTDPWGLLTAAGDAEVLDQGTNLVSSAPASPFNSGGYNLLAVRYNFYTNVATVNVNGSDMASLTLTGGNIPTDIHSAGFFVYNQPNTARFDAFAVSVSVPEPASIGSLLGIATLLLRRKSRS